MFLEVIQAIRARVGTSYPVWARINGQTYHSDEGTTPEEAQETARMGERAGLDAIHVSGYGGSLGSGFTQAPLVYQPGGLLAAAQRIKQVVKIPVIAVGRISPELGEKVLSEGGADFIAMGRPLLADPELPNKLASGRRDDIRTCICCYTCVHQSFIRQSVCCAVNAAVGKEDEFRIKRAAKPRKVLVIGGGPAGMEAARVASLRGHQVTLCDKERRLGGSLFFAAMARRENEDLINYLAAQIKKLPVRVKLGQELTPALIEAEKPDVVIVAVGPKYATVDIPGVDRKNVFGSAEMRQMISGSLKGDTGKKLPGWQRAMLYLGGPLMRRFLTPSMVRQLTKLWMPLGKRVVIIGGDLVGCELAGFLAERGKTVTVLESGKSLAPEMAIPLKWRLIDQLREMGVAMLTRVKYEAITPDGVVITDKEGKRQTIAADTVVLAAGVKPNLDLFQALQGKVAEAHAAGDCTELRLIRGSIADGSGTALKI
ncbi:MAG: FAD-dependent oxidoreductase [Chloroflexi bacterium]|nr:FAD-dependent oxidoreductase [Chloroflexota bacterium]